MAVARAELIWDQLLDDIILLCGNRLQAGAIALEKHYGPGLPRINDGALLFLINLD